MTKKSTELTENYTNISEKYNTFCSDSKGDNLIKHCYVFTKEMKKIIDYNKYIIDEFFTDKEIDKLLKEENNG